MTGETWLDLDGDGNHGPDEPVLAETETRLYLGAPLNSENQVGSARSDSRGTYTIRTGALGDLWLTAGVIAGHSGNGGRGALVAPPRVVTLSETPAHADLGLVEAPKPDDERFFPDTGRRISDDDIWSYYVRNGGVAEFGRPLSDPFLFTCCTMQIFEYASLNVSQPYLGVARMNVLDGDILGVTVLDGVRVPAYDPSIPGLLVPWQSDRACDGGASGFIGQRVGYGPDGRTDAFLTAYLTAEDVANDQAFRLLCLDGLERWGLPTSPAIVNPNGDGGVMQRFQRGVMWFEPDCGCIRRVSFGETLRHVFRGDEDGHPDLARAAVFGLFAPSLLHVGPAVEADRAVGILATGGVD